MPEASLPLLAAFAIFLFLIPFETLLSESLRTFSISKMAGWFFLAIALLDSGTRLFISNRATLMFAGYLTAYGLLGSIGPYGFAYTMSGLATLVQMVVLFHVCSCLLSDARAARVLLWCLWASTSVTSILQLTGVTARVYGASGRLSVLGEDPNMAGAVLSLGTVCGIVLLLTRGSGSVGYAAMVVGPSLPFLTWALVQTGSRGAVVGLASSLLVLSLTGRSRRKTAASILLVCLVISLLLWQTVSFGTAQSRWIDTLETGDTAGRTRIQSEAIQLFLERPLAGWGPSSNQDELGGRLGRPTVATHNQLLGVLTEVGVLGGLPYALGIVLCIRRAARSFVSKIAVGPLALLVGTLAISMSLDWHTRKLYWVVLAFAWASQAFLPSGPDREPAHGHR